MELRLPRLRDLHRIQTVGGPEQQQTNPRQNEQGKLDRKLQKVSEESICKNQSENRVAHYRVH